jgi:hypothetical protein
LDSSGLEGKVQTGDSGDKAHEFGLLDEAGERKDRQPANWLARDGDGIEQSLDHIVRRLTFDLGFGA